MSFLLDTNICSAHLRRPSGLTHRFVQHSGRLYISSVVLGELYTWAYRRTNPAPLLRALCGDFLNDVFIIDFDHSCAKVLGRVRADLLKHGIVVSPVDFLIAATALAHNLVLVTQNTQDFAQIPGLRLENWLEE